MRGGKVVNHQIAKSEKPADFLQTLGPEERKRARVERMRAQNIGNDALTSAVDDLSQPYWRKGRSLKEIEVVRENQKTAILQHQINNYMTSVNRAKTKNFDVICGQANFYVLTVLNNTMGAKKLHVVVEDPEVYESTADSKEFQLVRDQQEQQYWIKSGKADMSQMSVMQHNSNTIQLHATQNLELLFKFFTRREATFD